MTSIPIDFPGNELKDSQINTSLIDLNSSFGAPHSVRRPPSVMSDDSTTSSTLSNTTTNSATSTVSINNENYSVCDIRVSDVDCGVFRPTDSPPTSNSGNPENSSAANGVIDSYPRKSRVQNPWAPMEDIKLSEAVSSASQPLLWNKISMELPGRNGKQCRERWSEHLDPNFDRLVVLYDYMNTRLHISYAILYLFSCLVFL